MISSRLIRQHCTKMTRQSFRGSKVGVVTTNGAVLDGVVHTKKKFVKRSSFPLCFMLSS